MMRCVEAPDEAAPVLRPAERAGDGPFAGGVRLSGDFFFGRKCYCC